jgi:hypothetical protein
LSDAQLASAENVLEELIAFERESSLRSANLDKSLEYLYYYIVELKTSLSDKKGNRIYGQIDH